MLNYLWAGMIIIGIVYGAFTGKMPDIDVYKRQTSDGLTGTVHSLSVLRKLVKVVVNLENDEKEIREYQAEELKFRPRKRKAKVSKEEMRKLAELEKGEGASRLDDK